MDSILTSIKKLLGLTEEYVNFDPDIIIYINGVLMQLNLLGIGPVEGFVITDKTAKWADLLGTDNILLEGVKSYIVLCVKLIFDPPQTSFGIDAIKSQIEKHEWSLNVKVENAEVVIVEE